MRTMHGTMGALAALAASLAVSSAFAQNRGAVNLDPPGSDRAGKARRADAPPPEPTPAPGTRLGREVAAPADAAPPPVIGSQQIDRYDAIAKEQKAVEANPKSVTDWVILGELAHEVALDVPGDLAAKYFRMSRESFEKAQALEPGNPGLRAAVDFAREQEKNMQAFEASRDTHTDTFLDARRRDLVATGNTPYVRTYEPPLPSRTLPGPAPAPAAAAAAAVPARATTTPPPATPAAAAAAAKATRDRAVDSPVPVVRAGDVPVAEATPAVTPARTNAPATDAANYGTQQNYSAAAASPTYYVGPRYRPLATPEGVPYTYDQYSRSFFPAGIYSNPAAPPVTLQRYAPPVVPNAFERQILDRARTRTP